ncbi:MAG: DUF1569 domain-containing protein [Planctomycetota bacterium]|nr:MAG: DUF1569 domain-containing protein [Planctomycetota bacterium]
MVETAQVSGRRELHFDSYQEILDDVHRLASGPTKHLGNWSLGQCCEHLAKGMEYAVDGASFKASWILRLVGPLLKNRLITRPMKPGFKLPKNATPYLPGESDDSVGIARLEKAIERMQNVTGPKPHVFLGAMTREEWDQLHFRHAEMHLSFILPAE